MKCNKLYKDLILYAEDSLAPGRKKEINKHLSECVICHNFINDLIHALEIIDKEKKIETNPFLYSRILNKINNYEQSAHTFRVLALKILRPVIIVLLILSGIFSGIKLGSSYSSNYSDEDSELQIITYYLNDLQHEPVETILLSEELEIENIN
jgi:predicted anti-sigma-YlaC factor YlaD